MKKLLVKRPWWAFLLCVCFLCTAMSGGTNAAAAESSVAADNLSIFYGMVTDINGYAITVAIGTMAMPDFSGQGVKGGSDAARQNNASDSKEPSGTPQPGESAPQGVMPGSDRGSIADSLTLTGESVTVQITDDVTLTKQGARPGQNQGLENASRTHAINGENANQGNSPSSSPRAPGEGSQVSGFGFTGEEAVLEDITVDSIVILTYQTSTQALLSVHILSNPPISNT